MVIPALAILPVALSCEGPPKEAEGRITFVIGGLGASPRNVTVRSATVEGSMDGVAFLDELSVEASVKEFSGGTATIEALFPPSHSKTYTLFYGDVPIVSEHDVDLQEGGNHIISRPALSGNAPFGTRGMYKGREAVRVDLDSRKYVVATMNEGARSEEDFGEGYWTFENALARFSSGTQGCDAVGVWRLPTLEEVNSFVNFPNSSTYRIAVPGRQFSDKDGYDPTSLFFPFAGYVSGGMLGYGGTRGYFWSSQGEGTVEAHYLTFNVGYCNVYITGRNYALSVRLFCALPGE